MAHGRADNFPGAATRCQVRSPARRYHRCDADRAHHRFRRPDRLGGGDPLRRPRPGRGRRRQRHAARLLRRRQLDRVDGRRTRTDPRRLVPAPRPRHPRPRTRSTQLFAEIGSDIAVVIHTAAQPSHDWAAREPFTDFDVNAVGTLNMLEATRHHAPEAVFIFTSTNKVYGDTPNRLPLVEQETRWEIDPTHTYVGGIREDMSIDATLHSVFGASKVAADVMVQEYGRYFDMTTACFRGGTLTGPNHSAAELHGFLAYVMRCTMAEHAVPGLRLQGQAGPRRHPLARPDLLLRARLPRPAGRRGLQHRRRPASRTARASRRSICARRSPARELDWTYVDENRVGDHIWWIGDNGRFAEHYPGLEARVRRARHPHARCTTPTRIAGCRLDRPGPDRPARSSRPDRPGPIDRGKVDVIGVDVDAVDYAGAVARIIAAASERRPLKVSALAVHGVMTGVDDPEHLGRLNHFDLVTPDGQPVRWAMNWLHGTGLRDRVYGPNLTLDVCRAAVANDLSVYFYGTTSDTLSHLERRLPTLVPGIRIAGIGPVHVRALHPRRTRCRCHARARLGCLDLLRRTRLSAPGDLRLRERRSTRDADDRRRRGVRLPRRTPAGAARMDPTRRPAVVAAPDSQSATTVASVRDPQPALCGPGVYVSGSADTTRRRRPTRRSSAGAEPTRRRSRRASPWVCEP